AAPDQPPPARHPRGGGVTYPPQSHGIDLMNTGTPIRIMVVDDHPVVRFGLVAMLGAQPDFTVVAQASKGEEAIALFREHQPDVCLMDLRLPEIGGAEAIRLIRKEFPKSTFIVLTTFHGDE